MATAGYEVRVDGGTPIDVGNVLTYEVTGLSPLTEYDFQVRAYDASGNYSAWSAAVAETTLIGLLSANLILDVEPHLYADANGTTIDELTNSVVAENDGIQATDGNRAIMRTNEQNGKSAAEFNGTSSRYDFGDIFNAVTEGSFYFYGKKLNDPSEILKSGSWQTEVTSGNGNLLGYSDGAGNKIREDLFSNAYRETPYLGEPLNVTYFLYEVHSQGTNYTLILNGVVVYDSTTNTFAAGAGFMFGLGYGLYLEAKVARVLGYGECHDSTQRQAVRDYIISHYAADISDHLATNIICRGTSITASFPYSSANAAHLSYPGRLAAELNGNFVIRDNLAALTSAGFYRSTVDGQLATAVGGVYDRRREYRVRNSGAGGAQLQAMIDGFATEIEPFLISGIPNIIILEGGTNDIASPQDRDSTYILGKLAEFAALVAALGAEYQAQLVVWEILPRGWDGIFATYEAVRTAVNAGINSTYTNVIPVPALMGDYTDTTYYLDGIHPEALGYAIMGADAEAMILSLV